ncbi:UNVERIFIED_CONTAM: hypothetical protein Sradi_3858200 [Sesamum radiatum]|uniref:Uncharacterized protein n=1 Tax=Sesamum radiatum TaxID=300843 RepID=A0AAW2Q1Y9_SESRA
MELSPILLGTLQQMITSAVREQLTVLAPAQVTTQVVVPEQADPTLVIGVPVEEQLGIPFTKEVMADELPVSYRTPVIAEYDGTTDPQEHLSRFENAALLHDILTASNKEGESLKDYLLRFNTAALEVPSATQEVKASVFAQGLMDGDFFKSLAKKPATKFDVLLAQAAKYINMEEA